MKLSDEQIQDLLRVGNPTDEECRLIRLGWDAATREKNAMSVPEGWQLVPTAESRHPGIYKMLGALHAADNTPGASEWESYRAMLAAAPEAK